MMLKGKKILVTGATGFIGVNLIKRLLERGADIRATIYKRSPIINDGRIEYISCDLRNSEDCTHVCKGMEWVFHCAANTSGAAIIEKTPLVHLTPNVIINSLILEAAYTTNVTKFLFISSNVVYPDTGSLVKEDDVTNEFFEKYHIAAWMKRFSEIMCEMYALKINNPMTTLIVRPGNIYGPMDDFNWETSHVIPALIRRVVERHDPIVVWGDGQDEKDFIFIDDFIDGLLLVMQKMESFNIVNIASGKAYKLRDILAHILRITSYNSASIIYDKSKPKMIPKRLIDISKAKYEIGFIAKTSIQEGLQKTIEWYQNHQIHS